MGRRDERVAPSVLECRSDAHAYNAGEGEIPMAEGKRSTASDGKVVRHHKMSGA
jgi:hypothetical protein